MSIQTEINRIKQSKENIISALETKGVTVPSDASIDDLSALVDAIEVATDPVLQSKTVTPTISSQTVKPDTGYDGLSQVTVNAMPTATQATPSISVSTSGLITASSTQSAGYVSAGTKSATKQLTTKSATTWTPKTSNQTIASGTYLTGTQTIKGDSNLKADNIKSGVSIFGVTGTLESGGGSQIATGTFSLYGSVDKSSTIKSITGLGFQPTSVIIFRKSDYTNTDSLERYTYKSSTNQISVIYNTPEFVGCHYFYQSTKTTQAYQYFDHRTKIAYITLDTDGFSLCTDGSSTTNSLYIYGTYYYIAIG